MSFLKNTEYNPNNSMRAKPGIYPGTNTPTPSYYSQDNQSVFEYDNVSLGSNYSRRNQSHSVRESPYYFNPIHRPNPMYDQRSYHSHQSPNHYQTHSQQMCDQESHHQAPPQQHASVQRSYHGSYQNQESSRKRSKFQPKYKLGLKTHTIETRRLEFPFNGIIGSDPFQTHDYTFGKHDLINIKNGLPIFPGKSMINSSIHVDVFQDGKSIGKMIGLLPGHFYQVKINPTKGDTMIKIEIVQNSLLECRTKLVDGRKIATNGIDNRNTFNIRMTAGYVPSQETQSPSEEAITPRMVDMDHQSYEPQDTALPHHSSQNTSRSLGTIIDYPGVYPDHTMLENSRYTSRNSFRYTNS